VMWANSIRGHARGATTARGTRPDGTPDGCRR
jgi:hypothetical protein